MSLPSISPAFDDGMGTKSIDGINATFLRVIADHAAGYPMDDSVQWTHLTRAEIAELLQQNEGITVKVTVVDQLLGKHQCRRRQV
ncbi:MAG: hypothetical protein ACFB12_11280 [Leptolyngbyaceae cyanobacterium]